MGAFELKSPPPLFIHFCFFFSKEECGGLFGLVNIPFIDSSVGKTFKPRTMTQKKKLKKGEREKANVPTIETNTSCVYLSELRGV